MVKDEDLRNVNDYSSDQKEAAYRVLMELVNLFECYKDDIRLVGGWVPSLMYPDKGHIGSIDVDLLINHLALHDEGYQNMSKILLRNGYREHPSKYFSFIKTININGINYDVDVDILAGMYGGTDNLKRSQHVQGIKALKATGGNFAFEIKPQIIKIKSKRVDGAIDVGKVNVVGVVPFIIMKTMALGRGKAKDAYDIYFVVKNYDGGIKELAKQFEFIKDKTIVKEALEKLSDKFQSLDSSGPKDIVDFLDITDEEHIAYIKRDSFEQINSLIKIINNN